MDGELTVLSLAQMTRYFENWSVSKSVRMKTNGRLEKPEVSMNHFVDGPSQGGVKRC